MDFANTLRSIACSHYNIKHVGHLNMYAINVTESGSSGWTLHYETKEAALKEWDELVEHGKEGDKLTLALNNGLVVATATAKGKEYT